MTTDEPAPTTIDEYTASFPPDVQAILQQIRQTIRKAAPDASEKIGYGIPTFTLGGRNLVHFGAYANHIGFYPAPSGIERFKDELTIYRKGKGTLQFPMDEPIPYDLIRRVTEFRVGENTAKAAAKAKKK